jgi:hypothetical protein
MKALLGLPCNLFRRVMKPLSEFYSFDMNGHLTVRSYQPLLESIGHEVVLQRDSDGYQGDSLVLFRSEAGRWGVLTFGWGSCSHCDALEGCNDMVDLEALREDLYRAIIWGNEGETVHYLTTHDWEGTHLDRSLWEGFVTAALDAMEKAP